MDVTLIEASARPTVVVARQTTWAEFPRLWKPMLDAVYEQVSGPDWQNMMLYLDDRPSVEVGVLLEGRTLAPAPPVVLSSLPAGRAATATYRGEYAGLGQAHQAVVDWCAEHGHTRAGPSWEIYGHERGDVPEVQVFYLLA